MGASVFYESASELATLTNTFNVDGTPTDPTAVSLTVTTPSGTATTYTYAGGTITKSATGVYTKDIPCTEDSIWQYVWTGTGAASDVTAGTWTVFATDLQRNYCSVEELKSRLGIPASDNTDDFELKLAVESASRWVDGYCRRTFYRISEARTFSTADLYLLGVDDFVSITTVKTDPAGDGLFETTWDASDFQLLPVAGSAPEIRPYNQLRAIASLTFPTGYGYPRDDRIEVTAVWGWPSIPAAVKMATLIVAAEFFKLKDTFAGSAGFGEFGPVPVRRSPQALDLLRPYRRIPVLVA